MTLLPAAIADSKNDCIFPAGTALPYLSPPHRENTIALLAVLMGKTSSFLSCNPWFHNREITSSLAYPRGELGLNGKKGYYNVFVHAVYVLLQV